LQYYVDRPIVTDGVAWAVCWSDMIVNPAKLAEPIEMPFGMWSCVGLGNHVLNGGPDPCTRRGNFDRKMAGSRHTQSD